MSLFDTSGSSSAAGAWQLAGALSDEQRAAVEFGLREPERPLIVLAGPGTGKTRVIMYRIARLVEAGSYSGPVEPESILAVTFTVGAATQMRDRLAGLVGGAMASRVRSHTFHALGNTLLHRFGDVLGLDMSRTSLIDSAQRTRMYVALMLEHDLFRDRASEGRRALVGQAEAFITAAHNRALTPKDCLAYATRWIDAAERSGGSGEAALAERTRAAHFGQHARLFELVEQECLRRRFLTFEHLIALPIRLLRDHAGIAAVIRQEFRHIVVDEFQDMNPAQIELLRLLSPPTGAGGPARDVCVVGDDDQAIYGFRGASDRAFADFAALYPDHARLPLTGNYRSGRAILDVANDVMSRAESRFDPDKRVVPARDSAMRDVPGSVRGIVVADDEENGAVVASMIRGEMEADPARAWRDFAVIARNKVHLDVIASEMQVAGIPFRVVSEGDPGNDPAVSDLLAWIELLAVPTSRHQVQRLLMRPPFSVPADMVGRWASAFKNSAAFAGFDATMLDYLAEVAPQNEAVGRLRAVHAELAKLAATESAGRMVLEIINRAALARPPEDRSDRAKREHFRRVKFLVAMLVFVRSREERLEEPRGIAEFYEYWNDLSDGDRRELAPNAADLIDRDSDDDESASDAVSLLTAHKAKGLEFEVVFLPRVRPGGYPAKNRAAEPPLIPLDLVAPWERVIGRGESGDPSAHADEERRLFFVACTRAHRQLVLLAKFKKSPGSTADYFIELGETAARQEDGSALVNFTDSKEILAGAGTTPDMFDLAASRLPTAVRLGARHVRAIRARLAGLISEAEMDGVDAESLGRIEGEVRSALARLAVSSRLARHGEVPATALADQLGAGEFARALAQQLGGGTPETAPMSMRPPLALSFAKISDYDRCPRCFYLKHVLQLDDEGGPQSVIGQAAHEALEGFYRRFREADAAGEPAPTVDHLLELGRMAFRNHWPASRTIDPSQEDQVLAQLRLTHERLHTPGVHILEIERRVVVMYERAGHLHSIGMRIDRIDQEADGGLVLIDYKTGAAARARREPEADDLQLGLYAMALPVLFPDFGGAGRAEYWLLQTGERGSIAIADLDLDAVRESVDRAIDGMLAGRFEPRRSCDGVCRVFPLSTDEAGR
ncbi:MAG: ATP-dependent helicase [Phycisphaeraceae bacterium]|nr:ATP-dependent helicase [Phycisphaeraceae bacterium]